MPDTDKNKDKAQELQPDDQNPEYLFSTTHTELLVQIVRKEINPYELAEKQLRNRGLNKEGRWAGFDRDR